MIAASRSASPQTARTGPCILIADDAAAIRGVYRVILAEHGYQVIEAADGCEAIIQYTARRPDIVLLDIDMSRVDGIAALICIKELDPEARIVMLAAEGDRRKMVSAVRAGARGFVETPLQVDRVLFAIQRLLATP